MIHPESLCGKIPKGKLKGLTKEVIAFSREFLKYGKTHKLDDRLEAYGQEVCPRNHIPFHIKDTGKTKRRSFFCEKCQVLYK
jgi:endonuclease VIII